MVAISDRQVLEALLAKAEPRLRRRVRTLIEWLRGRNSLKAITALVQQGRALRSFDPIDVEKAAVALSHDVELIFRAAAAEVAKVLVEGLDVPIAYDATNPRAVAALDRMGARLVREITENQRDTIIVLARDGMERGLNPRVVARGIQQSVGLTAKQTSSVLRYEQLLRARDRGALERKLRDARFDRTVERAIASDAPLTEAQIQRMTAAYYRRAVAFRAETIARTEMLPALHEGADEMWRQAQERGELDAGTIECEWHAGKTPRTRDSHAAMDHQKRALGETFLSGDGYPLRFPGDPSAPVKERARCRCLKTTRYRQPAIAAAA